MSKICKLKALTNKQNHNTNVLCCQKVQKDVGFLFFAEFAQITVLLSW